MVGDTPTLTYCLTFAGECVILTFGGECVIFYETD